MSLSPMHFNAVQKLQKKRAQSVKLNKTWLAIYEEYNIGTVSGESIHFLFTEIDELCKKFEEFFGVNPKHGDIPDNRIELAKITSNEKIGGRNVFDNYIQVASAGPIPCSDGSSIITNINTSINIHFTHIAWSEIKTVVIVENLIPFQCWNKINLPIELQNALFIYRGHAKAATGVVNIRTLKRSLKVYGYSDFDPSGIKVSSGYGFSGMIVPDVNDPFLLSKVTKKNEQFEIQKMDFESLDSYLKKDFESYSDILEWFSVNKTTIIQEAMMDLELKLIRFK